MQLIGARLQREIHDGAARLPVFRVEISGLNVDLLDGVHRGLCLIEHARRRIGARSAIYADLLGEALQSVLAGHRPALIAADRSTRNQPEKAHGVSHRATEVDWELAEFLRCNRSRNLRRLGLQHAGVSVHFHRFTDLADLQDDILRDGLTHANRDPVLPVCTKSRLLDRQTIDCGGEFLEYIFSGVAGQSLARCVSRSIRD